jgi:hypothetical protein
MLRYIILFVFAGIRLLERLSHLLASGFRI